MLFLNQLSTCFTRTCLRPSFVSLLMKLLRVDLAIASLHLQLPRCSSVSGVPLCGDRVNLLSRHSHTKCSHLPLLILSTVLTHSQIQKRGCLILKSLDLLSVFSLQSWCSLCPSPIPQDFPAL